MRASKTRTRRWQEPKGSQTLHTHKHSRACAQAKHACATGKTLAYKHPAHAQAQPRMRASKTCTRSRHELKHSQTLRMHKHSHKCTQGKHARAAGKNSSLQAACACTSTAMHDDIKHARAAGKNLGVDAPCTCTSIPAHARKQNTHAQQARTQVSTHPAHAQA
jgi:hypothetical protein